MPPPEYNPLMMHLAPDYRLALTRRQLLGRTATGIGTAALASLLNASTSAAGLSKLQAAFPNFAPKAKRVIYLFMSGGPSHIDLFDYKPALSSRAGRASVRGSVMVWVMRTRIFPRSS